GMSVVCSATYCHGGSTDSYSYWTIDGAENLILVTVTEHQTPQSPASPDWYGAPYAGDRCAMCHGNPPTGGGVWHSGYHGNQGPTEAKNQCQTCHYGEATGSNGHGTAITDKKLHLNGLIDVKRSGSGCIGCH